MVITSTPEISFYTTVYNNVREVEPSLRSLIHVCKRLRELYGVESEVIIVDSYSNDGTYEKILEIVKDTSELNVPIKVVRYRCSRGLGRHIGLMMCRGEYVVYVDMDDIYDGELLPEIVAHYIRDEKLRDKTFYIWLMPRRYAIGAGGISDLNRTEDIEFAARVAKNYEMLPTLEPYTYRPLERPFVRAVTSGARVQRTSSKLFITTFLSERRYARSLIGYFKREFRNKLDMIRGMGYRPSKLLRELLYLRKYRGVGLLIALAYHLFFYFITTGLRLPIYDHHPYLNNGSYVDYKMFSNYVELLRQLVKEGEIEVSEFRDVISKYLDDEKLKSIMEYLSRFSNRGILIKP
jgi:glycosyltransferase involved in cell wall biosynthesis